MQNETNILNENEIQNAEYETEAQNINSSTVEQGMVENQSQNPNEDETKNQNQSDNTNSADFEELIKGPYKDAFAKKVQSIINKRFKEQKLAENKSAEQNQTDQNKIAHPDEDKNSSKKADSVDSIDSTYNSLIEAGIDPETAYRVLHLDEIMDSSMRYGAELAAKQLTESLRKKAARPFESALSGKGYSAKITASTLTPEKRKELAKKALMGEQIGF